MADPDKASRLSRLAPNFWRLAHGQVAFVETPTWGEIALQTSALAWHGTADQALLHDTAAKLRLRPMLLATVPEDDRLLGVRAELLYTVGILYWAKGEPDQSI